MRALTGGSINIVTGFQRREATDNWRCLIYYSFLSQLVTKRRHCYLRKPYLWLSVVLLEMSSKKISRSLKILCSSLVADRCCLKVDHERILFTNLRGRVQLHVGYNTSLLRFKIDKFYFHGLKRHLYNIVLKKKIDMTWELM